MFKDQGKDSIEKRFERAKEKVDELMRLLNIDDEYRFAYILNNLGQEQLLELSNMLMMIISSIKVETWIIMWQLRCILL